MKVEMKDLGGSLEFRVTNTSNPLGDEDLEKIFRPFERAGTSGEPGFGLGLAIVKKIMEAHGGTVRAQNTEQGFAIFVVSKDYSPPEPANHHMVPWTSHS